MYLYESHMGGFYATENKLEDTYSETCNEFDDLLGKVNTFEDAWNLVKEKCAYDNGDGISLQYAFPNLCNIFHIYEDVPLDENDESFTTLTDDEILFSISRIIDKPISVYQYGIELDFNGKKETEYVYVISDTKPEKDAVAVYFDGRE